MTKTTETLQVYQTPELEIEQLFNAHPICDPTTGGSEETGDENWD